MHCRYLLVLVSGLTACSADSGPVPLAEPPLSNDAASAALRDAIAQQRSFAVRPIATEQSVPSAAPPTHVTVSACSAGIGATVCDVAFDAGDRWAGRVMFWPTANPRHPWRATLLPGDRP